MSEQKRTSMNIDKQKRTGYNSLMSEGLMTVKEALDHLKIGRTKLYDLISEGKLRTVKIGKRTLFDPDDVKKFVEGQKTGTQAPAPRKRGRPKKAASKK